jgi:hypothetical protein
MLKSSCRFRPCIRCPKLYNPRLLYPTTPNNPRLSVSSRVYMSVRMLSLEQIPFTKGKRVAHASVSAVLQEEACSENLVAAGSWHGFCSLPRRPAGNAMPLLSFSSDKQTHNVPVPRNNTHQGIGYAGAQRRASVRSARAQEQAVLGPENTQERYSSARPRVLSGGDAREQRLVLVDTGSIDGYTSAETVCPPRGGRPGEEELTLSATTEDEGVEHGRAAQEGGGFGLSKGAARAAAAAAARAKSEGVCGGWWWGGCLSGGVL